MAIKLPMVNFGSGEGILVDFVLRHGAEADLTPEECDAPRVFYLTDSKEFVVSRGDGTWENITREIKATGILYQTLLERVNVLTSLPEGSSIQEAELADLRVGFDGKVYRSAGVAMREQFEGLYQITGVTWEVGAVLHSGEFNPADPARLSTGYVACPAGSVVEFVGESDSVVTAVLTFYDAFRKPITTLCNVGPQGMVFNYTAPAGSVYARLCTTKELLKNSYIKVVHKSQSAVSGAIYESVQGIIKKLEEEVTALRAEIQSTKAR